MTKDYYSLHQNQIANLKKKPTLLIHVCCGVCSVFPLAYLREHFKVTVLYTNSNIYPYDEYQKRLEALEKSIARFDDIKLIVDNYDYQSHRENLVEYKDLKEGQHRCFICYKLRMEKGYEYAFKHKYDYYTTVMSISSKKNANFMNQIGEELQAKYQNCQFLYADFKKNNGQTCNNEMNKGLDLYHQDYCGCEFSKR